MIGTCPTAWQRSYDELGAAITRAPAPRVVYTWSWYWSRTFPDLITAPSRQLMRLAKQKAALTMLDPDAGGVWRCKLKPDLYVTFDRDDAGKVTTM